MTAVGARAPATMALAAALALLPGCAQIVSQSVVEIMPRPDASTLVLGPPGGEITARGVAVQWTQDGDRLALELTESRTCVSVRHVPVVRVERISRKTAGGAMWFEYGIGAAALATGLAGLIKPEAFSQAAVDTDGVVVKDKGAGYRIGGIFTGIGALLLTAAVIDTVRTRDEVLYTDAYRREAGGTVTCQDPLVPLGSHTVELLVGGWSSAEATDDGGRVRFLLPRADELSPEAQAAIAAWDAWTHAKADADARAHARAEAAEQAELADATKAGRKRKRGDDSRAGEPAAASDPPPVEEPSVLEPPPEPFVVKGVVRVDKARAIAVDFIVPYGREVAAPHRGEGSVDPAPWVDAPPRPSRAEPAAEG